MARQSTHMLVTGTINGVNYYKTSDGYLARAKGGVSAERIATDPAFERTRENGAEFGTAAKAAKVLRDALAAKLQLSSDKRISSKLTTEFMKVVYSDTNSLRGQRKVSEGNVELIKGFDFNSKAPLGSVLSFPYLIEIDRVTGKCTCIVEPFSPLQKISAPVGTTHFRLFGVGMDLDFETGSYVVDVKETAILTYDALETAAVNLESLLTPASINPIAYVFGIEFLQSVNNEYYSLKNAGKNAMKIVGVDVV